MDTRFILIHLDETEEVNRSTDLLTRIYIVKAKWGRSEKDLQGDIRRRQGIGSIDQPWLMQVSKIHRIGKERLHDYARDWLIEIIRCSIHVNRP